MQALLIWLFVLFSLVVPSVLMTWLWKGTGGKADWAVRLLLVGAYTLWIFLAAPWAIISCYLRFLLLPFFALAAYFSFGKIQDVSLQMTGVKKKLVHSGRLILLLLLLLFNFETIRGHFYPVQAVELKFPLRDGLYYVWQGGNSFITNGFHRAGLRQGRESYAIDIVKLNRAGSRAEGIYPGELSAYAIYGETVYSPCAGEIIEMLDGRSDNAIGYVAGHPSNYVAIRCRGVKVTLAHLLNGSILVEKGQLVREEQPLGKAGNSGNTIEPHLHMDAVKDVADGAGAIEEPIPMSFNGEVLSLNDVIRR
jgi:hypothetical protein